MRYITIKPVSYTYLLTSRLPAGEIYISQGDSSNCVMGGCIIQTWSIHKANNTGIISTFIPRDVICHYSSITEYDVHYTVVKLITSRAMKLDITIIPICKSIFTSLMKWRHCYNDIRRTSSTRFVESASATHSHQVTRMPEAFDVTPATKQKHTLAQFQR